MYINQNISINRKVIKSNKDDSHLYTYDAKYAILANQIGFLEIDYEYRSVVSGSIKSSVKLVETNLIKNN